MLITTLANTDLVADAPAPSFQYLLESCIPGTRQRCEAVFRYGIITGNASTIPHPIYAGHYYAGSMQSVVPKENWTRWKTGFIAFAKDKAITDVTQSVIY